MHQTELNLSKQDRRTGDELFAVGTVNGGQEPPDSGVGPRF